ncbi:hypothetical protein BJX99DRAFT_60475 [Aspergillus californicus]
MTSETPPSPDCTLPHEKVFSIQIGTELFRLSGASIASDAPSYFSRFFEEQLSQNGDGNNVRTLYIDRDPTTFQEIARHLQGYHCQPKDGSEFVKLFADAQFYSLPRLMSQLFESEIIIQIGDRHFQISRDIFSGPGDSPNFFSLGFGAFFASPAEVFPGLDRRALLRPPAIIPPSVPNRSGDVFAQLVHLLRGYSLHISSESQRAELLRDCRYFHLRGLEQKLIPHHISFNPIRGRSEIILRLDDVRRSGIHVDSAPSEEDGNPSTDQIVKYSRPFVDDSSYDLVLEIGDENTIIDTRTMRPKFLNLANARMTSLLQVIVDKKNNRFPKQPSTSEHSVRIQINEETDLTIDGEQRDHYYRQVSDAEPQAKRRRIDVSSAESGAQNSDSWFVRNGQWRISMRAGSTDEKAEFVLAAVKLDVYTSHRIRNRRQAFLVS